MKYFLGTVSILVLLSCSDDNVEIITSTDLKGKWIEMETKSDTLTFESWDNSEIMILSRGKEIRDGNLLPKYGSGSYEYRLSEGRISLYWMLSSNSSFKDYNFKIAGNRLNIENFYSSTSKPMLTFEKLD
ncbi:MAG: hypothetical protein AAGI07_00495 [Bacteroidota bacterium]